MQLSGYTYFPRFAENAWLVSLGLMRGVAASPMPIADVFPLQLLREYVCEFRYTAHRHWRFTISQKLTGLFHVQPLQSDHVAGSHAPAVQGR